MSEQLPLPKSDAVSNLVQLHAKRNGVNIHWTGKGGEDIAALCVYSFNQRVLGECMWNGIKELMAMPEIKELPEPIQAKIYSIILQAQSVFELRKAENTAKNAAPPAIMGAPG